MGSDKPRYLVRIKGCYYWRPTPRMKGAGFHDRALGKNKIHAKQEAIRLNAEWDRHRLGEPNQPNIMAYPPGSLGHAYARAIALREAERKAKGISWTRQQKARDDWPRAWRWIGPAFSDYDPLRRLRGLARSARQGRRARVGKRSFSCDQSLAGTVGEADAARIRSLTDIRQLCPTAPAGSLASARCSASCAARLARAALRPCSAARHRLGHNAIARRRAHADGRATAQRWPGLMV